MVYVNKNSALETLQGLVEQSFKKTQNYMPDGFSEKQQEALNLFKQRIYLEEVIEENISFNKQINWESDNPNLKLIRTVEDLIETYKLRSDIYSKIGYQNEFPDPIEGLNFDDYDKCSAVLASMNNKVLTGTLKVVFDKKNGLPSEEKVLFNHLREKKYNLVELSRFAISSKSNGLNQEFKHLFAGVYNLYKDNEIDLIISGIKDEHYKMYSKFGGVKVEEELNSYGNINKKALILSWNPAEVSPFFKRAFLNKR